MESYGVMKESLQIIMLFLAFHTSFWLLYLRFQPCYIYNFILYLILDTFHTYLKPANLPNRKFHISSHQPNFNVHPSN